MHLPLRLFPAFAALLALTACADSTLVTVTGDREADAVGQLQSDTRKVKRPFTSVVGGLRAGGAICLNRVLSKKDFVVSEGGGRIATVYTRYSSQLGTAPGRAQLTLFEARSTDPKRFGKRQAIYTVSVAADETWTVLTLSGGDETYRALDVGVMRWASGDSIICPKMPSEYGGRG